MKLRTLIVDDEYPARKELRYLLEKIDYIEVVGEAANAKEAMALISALDYAIIFLDIEMPGMSGIELSQTLQSLPNPPCIVFVTAYENYALKAFEVNAVDYILKPFDEKRLQQALAKILKLLQGRQTTVKHEQITGSAKFDRIPVEKQGKTVLIDEDDIYYAFTDKESVYLQISQERLLTRFTLKELESRLNQTKFFRVHRCYIVNLRKVTEIVPFFNGTYTLILNDKQKSEVPVSRNQARKLKTLLGI